MPSLKEIKTYLTTDLKLPLIVPKNIEEKFSAVTQIYPKSSSLVMLYSNNELKLVEKKWGYPSPFQKNRVLYNARIERFYEVNVGQLICSAALHYLSQRILGKQ